jgi:adhesin transport system outer membrane protein
MLDKKTKDDTTPSDKVTTSNKIATSDRVMTSGERTPPDKAVPSNNVASKKRQTALRPAPKQPLSKAAAPVTTLRAAVRRATKLHPVVRAALSRLASAKARSRVVRGALVPSVDVGASTGAQHYRSPSDSVYRGQTLWRNEASVTATQLIFDGFQAWHRYKEAKSNTITARYRVADAKQKMALAAIAAYIDVLRNRELVAIAQRNVANHRAVVGTVRRMAQSGRTDSADVAQAASRLALAVSDLELREGQLKDAEARFIAILNVEPGRLSPVQMPRLLRRKTLQQALKESQKFNPKVRIARSEVRSRRYGVKGTKGLFVPRLDVELSGRVGSDLDGVVGRTDDLRALLKVSWNLYRGGADIARRQEAIANLSAAQHDEAAARRAIRERVLRAFALLNSNIRQLRAMKSRVVAAGRVLRAYIAQFDLGRRTLLDRLDAQRELFLARAEQTDTQYTVLLSHYILLAATGELLSTFNVK